MKNKIIIGLIIVLNLFVIGYYTNLQQEEKVLSNYTTGFNGVVVEKFNPREKLPHTFLKIRIQDDKLINVYPTTIIGSYAVVGDSIIKMENSNKCIVKKSNGVVEHFSFEGQYIEFLNE
ncbi:hypothetical protein [Myroides odoratimimus]|uniref:hypothetical protein n=1 Tax=Myroides odoratimimus TaxID=76832 RepID=UPI0024C09D4C|nr:hypothetical protein [Myroides odoratimimus]WHU37681.1 hypothetical protein QNM93_15505 [Myroides odoratimimus]